MRYLVLRSFLLMAGLLLAHQSMRAQSDPLDWGVSNENIGPLVRVSSPSGFRGLSKNEKRFLTPPDDLKTAHRDFLKQPDTGLLKLLSPGGADYRISYEVTGRGTRYSFTHKTHLVHDGSDLAIEKGFFKSGFGNFGIGILVNLKDVKLEDVTIETKGVKFLADLAAPKDLIEGHALWNKSYAGFSEGDQHYRNQLPIVVGNTYVVRAINDRKSDVLVAFRPMSQDKNGTVILLWKKLKAFSKPKVRL